MDDLRQVLEAATTERRRCRVSRVDGAWWPGVFLRIEPTGVVIDCPDCDLRGGEEVRLWLGDEAAANYLEATVLRAGVAGAERGTSGLLIGFMARVATAGGAVDAAWALEIRLPSGAPINLLQAPVVVLDLGVDHVAFEVPRTFPVRFPEQGALSLRFAMPGDRVVIAQGRVREAVAGDARWLYRVDFERVDDASAHRALVLALRARIWARAT